MRGKVQPQAGMFSYMAPKRRIPPQHPLRTIKSYADTALKGQLLIALYSVRSDRAFCEQLDYNLLFRWFLGMSLDDPGLDQSNFSRLREPLVETDIARRFFDQVLKLAKSQQLLVSEHFTVDSTLIESWASLKSLKKKGGPPPKTGGDSSGMVDFTGERRTHATRESTTNPEAKPMRRDFWQPAKLSFAGHALMDNRADLCADLQITDVQSLSATVLLARQWRKRVTISTLTADKGYYNRAFVALCEQSIRPHIARIASRRTPALDGRTTRHGSYALSQRHRKCIEEIFGWLKTAGGLRQSRFVRLERIQLYAYLAASAYHLLRMTRLAPLTT